MSLFDLYNAIAAPPKPIYRKNSELPLFVPMQMLDMKPAVTNLGPTHQLNVKYGNAEYFFYLNAYDHARVIQYNGVPVVKEAISKQNHPFAVCIRKAAGLGTLILESSKELIEQWQSNKMIFKSQIPTPVMEEIDLEGLANSGIVLQ